MNPENEERVPSQKDHQNFKEKQKVQINKFSLSMKLLSRRSRSWMHYLNIINLLSHEQEPQDDEEYLTCLNYVETRKIQGICSDGRSDFFGQFYEGPNLIEKRIQLIQNYMYHRTNCFIVDQKVEKIMSDYQHVKRKHHYMKIKRMLNKLHGCDLQSLEDESGSNEPPSRSKYSNMLDQLSQIHASRQVKNNSGCIQSSSREESNQLEQGLHQSRAFQEMYQTLILTDNLQAQQLRLFIKKSIKNKDISSRLMKMNLGFAIQEKKNSKNKPSLFNEILERQSEIYERYKKLKLDKKEKKKKKLKNIKWLKRKSVSIKQSHYSSINIKDKSIQSPNRSIQNNNISNPIKISPRKRSKKHKKAKQTIQSKRQSMVEVSKKQTELLFSKLKLHS